MSSLIYKFIGSEHTDTRGDIKHLPTKIQQFIKSEWHTTQISIYLSYKKIQNNFLRSLVFRNYKMMVV